MDWRGPAGGSPLELAVFSRRLRWQSCCARHAAGTGLSAGQCCIASPCCLAISGESSWMLCETAHTQCEPPLLHWPLQMLHLCGMLIILNRTHEENSLGVRKHSMNCLCPSSPTQSLSSEGGLHLGPVVPPVNEQSHAGAVTERVQHAMPQAAVEHEQAVLAGGGQQAAPRRLPLSPGGAVLLIHHHCGSWQPERVKLRAQCTCKPEAVYWTHRHALFKDS